MSAGLLFRSRHSEALEGAQNAAAAAWATAVS